MSRCTIAPGCRRALLVFAALLPALASATTYTCIGGDGRKSFSDRPCPTSNADNARRDAGAAGLMAVRHGHTFGVRAGAAGQAVVSASCDAAPAPTDRPREGGCDAQRGDTACSRALPVLCIKQAERGKAAVAAAPGATSGALPAESAPRLGASAALRGDTLLSQQSGTQACTAALGAGWRMAGVSDGSAWSDRAGRHASLANASGRYWVATDEPAGNCWDAPPAAEAARAPASPAVPPATDPAALTAELSKLRSTPEFARLSAPCRASFDKVERGLRANAEGGPSEAALAPLVAWLEQCGKEAAAPAR